MEGLLNVQYELHNIIKKGFSNFKKTPKDRLNFEYIEVKSENLEHDWLSFRSNNIKLYQISEPDGLSSTQYVKNEMYESTEDIYLLYKSLIKKLLNQYSKEQPSKEKTIVSGQQQDSWVKLPKITIPTFSGNYSEWTTFRDLFLALIHNNETLDSVQKLHYLKSHLTDEAEQLIRHTPITGANYGQCWSLLEQRYNNRKFLANNILKRLFGIKHINLESASGLKVLIDTTIDCLNALKNIDIDVSTWDIIIIHIVSFKLDQETRKQWELHISSSVDLNNLPTLDQFKCFIENRFRALEFVESRKSSVQRTSGNSSRPKTFVVTNESDKRRCEFCSGSHKLCFCKKFASEDVEKRRDFVANNSICFNCLGSNHRVHECRKSGTCRIDNCRKRHHSLLHPEQESQSRATSSTAREPVESARITTSAEPIVSCLSTQRSSNSGQVLLATALVKAESETGDQNIRALIDQGSQACFITESAVKRLQLKKTAVSGTITGLGGDRAINSKNLVTIKFKSRFNRGRKIEVTAYVLKDITCYLPEKRFNEINWIELQNLSLADPHFNRPNKIELLLGANVYSQILQDGIKKDSTGTLLAQNTSLGWILTGKVTCQNQFNSNSLENISVLQTDILKRV
ncbi:uncharacterized protein LOC128199462 [Bicyclus anynana]|uniref:Uncharacterized protein LOC128199462 n=1 Tax=Bicyclus anynana TaxID=110368 RepID=A0ABM3M102_BICAN|nr:uncharacterized protein LOC128199462 [Bicyclus anynana]